MELELTYSAALKGQTQQHRAPPDGLDDGWNKALKGRQQNK
jgi:hypothetical protein